MRRTVDRHLVSVAASDHANQLFGYVAVRVNKPAAVALLPDASRITPPRIVPGFDPGTSLGLEVELLGAVSELACSQHAVRQVLDAGRAKIELSRTDELLNRDFILRWRLIEEGSNPSLAYYRRNDGEVYGLLSIMAPRGNDASEAEHRDVVFMLDRSGSMDGAKMASGCARV